MNKQVIISIGREYGTGGHEIAEKIAKKYNFPLYDKSILRDIAKEKSIDSNELEEFDERPRNIFTSRTVSGFSSSPEEIVADMEFDFLKEKAENGESFVIVGRCANSVLKDYNSLISIFINGNMDEKEKRIMKLFNVSGEEAKKIVIRENKKRKSYHNYYCKEKWGDSRYYELTVNSSIIGTNGTAEIIESYIDKRLEISKF